MEALRIPLDPTVASAPGYALVPAYWQCPWASFPQAMVGAYRIVLSVTTKHAPFRLALIFNPHAARLEV